MKKKKIIPFLLLLILFAAMFFCSRIQKTPLTSTTGQSYEKAVVVDIIQDNLQEDGNRYGSQQVAVKMKSGNYRGEVFQATSLSGTLFGADCTLGMNVIVIFSDSADTQLVTVYSQDRSAAILGFFLFFAFTVCVIGGKKGLMSILGLLFTFLSILFLLFPLFYRGVSPVLSSILVSAISAAATLVLVGGLSSKTASAILGTTCGVSVSAVSALVFGSIAGISGYNVSDIETLNYVAQYTPIRIGELLFAGIIISSLGAVMDVGMSISSALQEICETDPTRNRKQLFMAGIRIGRDMIGTMTNTLILAYVGGSLTTLVINYAYDLSTNQLLNSYNMGIEIMQGLSGSLGIVLAVPFTAAFSAVFLTARQVRGNTAEKKKKL
ncbi:MAG: YibE/F family protein [Clostridiales bacterium]|nr:YibE/F family protein [Clostridiales bacterium]